jgi:hypothetical protein
MAGINKIKPFCENGAVVSEADYETLRKVGNVKGRASSAFVNKALKQSSYVAAGLGEAVAEVFDKGVSDENPLSDMIDGIKALLASMAVVSSAEIPTGGIISYTGTEASLDEMYQTTGVRWYICNGQNGTPDLRDRFIVGSGGKYAVGAKGGSETVTLDVSQIPSHNHRVCEGAGGVTDYPSGVGFAPVGSDYPVSSGYTGGGQPHENRPPYYALAYIMKGTV